MMARVPIRPPLQLSFDEVYRAISLQAAELTPELRTTGGVPFVASVSRARDGRRFISLPHSVRIYEQDWGYQNTSMGGGGQRIGHYARPLDQWAQHPGELRPDAPQPAAVDDAARANEPATPDLRTRPTSELRRRCSEILDDFELALRSFVSDRMQARYGAVWWKQRVPEGVRKGAAERRERSNNQFPPVAPAEVIHYTLLTDLAEIVLRSDNYVEVFREFFGSDRDRIRVRLDEIAAIRNAVMHIRPTLSSEDYERLVVMCRDVFRGMRVALPPSFPTASSAASARESEVTPTNQAMSRHAVVDGEQDPKILSLPVVDDRHASWGTWTSFRAGQSVAISAGVGAGQPGTVTHLDNRDKYVFVRLPGGKVARKEQSSLRPASSDEARA